MSLILLKTLFRQKKIIIIYSSLLILSFLSLFSINTITNYIKSEKINNIIENEDNRKFYIYPSENNDFYEKIKNREEIENIYYDYRFQTISFGDYTMELISDNTNKDKEIISGRSILSGSSNEILIPDRYKGLGDYNAQQYLDKMIDIIYDERSIRLHIVGIYKNQEDINKVYISENNSFIESLNYSCIVITHSQSDVSSIASYVQSMGHSVDLVDSTYQSEMITYQKILNTLMIIKRLFVGLLLIVIFMLLFSIILEEKYNIAILKLCGYSSSSLIKNLILLLLFLLSTTYTVAFSTYYVVIILINNLFSLQLLVSYYYIFEQFCQISIMILLLILLSVYCLRRLKIIKLLSR